MALTTYNKKRNFKNTPEPKGDKIHKGRGLTFVVQKHDASRLHYDFRLEMEGVLKSWAVPKGPSLDPSVKRLAVQVEDHPWSYRDFEGEIPEGNYGAGDVIVWDTGTYAAAGGEKELLKGLEDGSLTFTMNGQKLRGEFSLVRTRRDKQWLLIKKDDTFATKDEVTEQVNSALSSRILKRDANKTPARTSSPRQTNAHPKKAKKLSFTAKDLKPMLATLTDAPFDDPNWIYEVKWDGYRVLAVLSGGEVMLVSRNGLEVTAKYPALTEALSQIDHDAVLDGELVAVDSSGNPKFSLMQNAGSNGARLHYYTFDLLFLDGEDVRPLPLLSRKEKLQQIFPKQTAKSVIRFSEHIDTTGKKYFAAAEKQNLEGIIAKRKDSPYRSGTRSEDWLKIKTSKRQEVVIVGYTEPKGSRKYFGSLVLATHDTSTKTGWRYVGHVGTGFNIQMLRELHAQMKPLEQKTKPVSEKVPEESKITWLKPQLICEVKFTEWTEDRQMRHPVYMGLRNDKKAREVLIEQEVRHEKLAAGGGAASHPTVEFSHLDKIYWPTNGYTKGDLINYYDQVADTMLPYLKDRPMVLNRHPNGIGKPGFYQKDVEPGNLPKFVKTTVVHSESTDEDIDYIVCDNKETLLYLANLGCIEMNPWSSRTKNLNRPDFLVIDLDPGDNTFEQVIEVAKVVHEVLEMSCEKSYVKTSGKTGLHIFVPLKAKYDFDKVRTFAELLVRIVHERMPDITSLERSPSKRKDKIYLDYLQNRIGQTLAAPYSVRPVEGACVSAPLEWSEVRKGLTPDKFTIKTIFKRLKDKGDLWNGILDDSVDLKAALKCLQEHLSSSRQGTHPR